MGLELINIAVENCFHVTKLCCKEFLMFRRYGWWWKWRYLLYRHYYSNPPHRLVRRFYSECKGVVPETDLIYGEISPVTGWNLLHKLGVEREDVLVELGCGRANLLFIGALGFGVAGIGVDIIEDFVVHGRQIAERLGVRNLRFIRADFRKEPLPEGSIYFVSPTTLCPQSWHRLRQRLSENQITARWVVSLTRTLESPLWELKFTDNVDCSWGMATVYAYQPLSLKHRIS